MGVKAIAVYRDGSKRQQALTTSRKSDTKQEKVEVKEEPVVASIPVAVVGTPDFAPRRRRLPDERRSITHRFKIGNQKGYMTVGLYDDNTPGELFIVMAKEGSVVSGLMGAFATSISMALQYGVPLPVLVNKFVHTRFEPSGFTNNPNIRMAKSIVDYIFRWMGMKFLTIEDQKRIGINNLQATTHVETELTTSPAQPDLFKAPEAPSVPSHTTTFDNTSDAPACDTCGSIMVRNGACYKCLNCGETSGCS
jgi:ribonucleoside-diphosphate reductase alpha chain